MKNSGNFIGWMRQSICWLMLGSLSLACSVKKYIPEEEYLLKGSELELDFPDDEEKYKEVSRALDKVLYPKPNSRFLGMHIGLWSHYKVEAGKAGFIARYLERKYGEEPVYLSDVDLDETEKLLLNRLENRGYFYPDISSETRTRSKKGTAVYTVKTGNPYRLKQYQYLTDSNSAIDSMLHWSLRETLLTPGSKFNLDQLKKERNRIDQLLKNRGFYFFNSRYLVFTTDTNHYDEQGFDLFLRISAEAPRDKLIPYKLGKVTVYSGLDNADDTEGIDTASYAGIRYYQDPEWVKPRYIDKQIASIPDSTYRLRYAQATARRLSSLGAYQHASIRFYLPDSGSSASKDILDAHILLTPARQFNLRTGTHAVTKSTGFAGPGLVLNFQNRNLFGGAELLEINGVLGYEFQISRGSSRGLNNFEFSLENSLTFPRLLVPGIKFNKFRAFTIPNTRIKLNLTNMKRALYYSMNNIYTALSYDWYRNPRVRWDITPLSLNYMHVFNKTDDFLEIVDNNPFLARSLDDQFIPAMSVGWRYSEFNEAGKINRFYLSLSLEQAGLLVGATSKNDTLLGLPFAQYVKTDLDFRHDVRLSEGHHIVNRILVGVGSPYGNSASLPYVRQYFAGGPNSVRAFLVRSLGPGAYVPTNIDNSTFFDQAGDIRLELNSEYRFPILGYLKGALFVDAGNIWLMNDNPSLPGGQFTSDWFRQLGVGAGLGLRVDAQVLVIRLDVSRPVKYPTREFRDFWVANQQLGGLVWNFAIGYPF